MQVEDAMGSSAQICQTRLHPGFEPPELKNYISQKALQSASSKMKAVVSGQPALKGDHAASIREIMKNISQHALLWGVARLNRSTVDYNHHYALHRSRR